MAATLRPVIITCLALAAACQPSPHLSSTPVPLRGPVPPVVAGAPILVDNRLAERAPPSLPAAVDAWIGQRPLLQQHLTPSLSGAEVFGPMAKLVGQPQPIAVVLQRHGHGRRPRCGRIAVLAP